MAYDEALADRVRALVAGRPGFREQKMFGGLAFMLNGNMACGIMGSELIVRVGKENFDATITLPHARVFDMTGRPMRSFIHVAADGLATDEGLTEWADRGIAYVDSMPPKLLSHRSPINENTSSSFPILD